MHWSLPFLDSCKLGGSQAHPCPQEAHRLLRMWMRPITCVGSSGEVSGPTWGVTGGLQQEVTMAPESWRSNRIFLWMFVAVHESQVRNPMQVSRWWTPAPSVREKDLPPKMYFYTATAVSIHCPGGLESHPYSEGQFPLQYVQGLSKWRFAF